MACPASPELLEKMKTLKSKALQACQKKKRYFLKPGFLHSFRDEPETIGSWHLRAVDRQPLNP